jgi:hypothetical protein
MDGLVLSALTIRLSLQPPGFRDVRLQQDPRLQQSLRPGSFLSQSGLQGAPASFNRATCFFTETSFAAIISYLGAAQTLSN